MYKPKYDITSKILTNLTTIAEIKVYVEKSKIIPSRESLLRKSALVKMAHSSTSIEGNSLLEYEVEKVARGQKINAVKREIVEVENYLKALKLVDKIHKTKKIFGNKEILDIHKVVLKNLMNKSKVGVFRVNPVYIVNMLPSGADELVYTPPEHKHVKKLTTDLVSWLNKKSDIHPIIKAGIFHYQYVSIHPFSDGNGRTTRLLTLLYLYQSGFTFKKSLVLDDFYNDDRKRYYENLQTGKIYKDREGADLTGWLEYFTEGFLSEAQKLKDQILSFSGMSKDSGEKDIVLGKDSLQIVDFVVNIGEVTSDDVVDILGTPKRTAQDKLKKLVGKKVLKKVGSGPATHYVLVD